MLDKEIKFSDEITESKDISKKKTEFKNSTQKSSSDIPKFEKKNYVEKTKGQTKESSLVPVKNILTLLDILENLQKNTNKKLKVLKQVFLQKILLLMRLALKDYELNHDENNKYKYIINIEEDYSLNLLNCGLKNVNLILNNNFIEIQILKEWSNINFQELYQMEDIYIQNFLFFKGLSNVIYKLEHNIGSNTGKIQIRINIPKLFDKMRAIINYQLANEYFQENYIIYKICSKKLLPKPNKKEKKKSIIVIYQDINVLLDNYDNYLLNVIIKENKEFYDDFDIFCDRKEYYCDRKEYYCD